MTIDLFNLRNPKDLFSEIQLAIMEYHEHPTSRLLLFLLFSLNHLGEWIAEKSHRQVQAKIAAKATLTPGEQFFSRLWDVDEFRTLNSLCNRSKHHVIGKGVATSVTEGMAVDSPVSDSLGQIYYRIDGTDSREVFARVMREYNTWFAANG